MRILFRVLLAVALIVTNGAANADQETTLFATAVKERLSRLHGASALSDAADSGNATEQTIIVDVNSDGSVARVQNQAPIADKGAYSKIQRLIFMASPFPSLPASLSKEYSAVRLAIVYVVAADERLSISRVEVKGGYKYVDF